MKTEPGVCRICSRKLKTRGAICKPCRISEKESALERELEDLPMSPPNQSLYERIVNEIDDRDEEES
jgi:hypothetical protein